MGRDLNNNNKQYIHEKSYMFPFPLKMKNSSMKRKHEKDTKKCQKTGVSTHKYSATTSTNTAAIR